jgi:hypothetical protein
MASGERGNKFLPSSLSREAAARSKKKLKQKSKENDNVSFSIAISKSANTLFRSFACLNVAVGVARYYLEFSLSIFEGF